MAALVTDVVEDAWATFDEACRYPVGPDNDRVLLQHTQNAHIVLAAWGTHGALHVRAASVEQLLSRAGLQAWCLGITKAGYPRHPLYVRGSTPLVVYPLGAPS